MAIHSPIARLVALLVILALRAGSVAAQSAPSADSSNLNATYVFAALGGFIPMTESYRLNYSTKLIGVPLEVSGGLVFPITREVLVPFTIRYVRREANFIASTSIGVLSLEPGVRFYFEKERPRDLRIFGAFEALLAEANVGSIYDVSSRGEVTSTAPISKDYFNLGVGFDVGIAYPLTSSSALDGIVHTAVYFTNPVTHGGLGNIGGISLTIGYRIGF